MKTVCVVGAGPGGLVGAKTLLKTGRFAVTVFEKAERIGGIWALDEETVDGRLSPETPTNLSRFTVGFSDLDWNSVNLRRKNKTDSTKDASVTQPAPLFPKAWQVNRYLQEYQERYVPDETVLLGHEVIEAKRIRISEPEAGFRWRIKTRNRHSQERIHEFDYLLIASGFFSNPRPPGLISPVHKDGGDGRSIRVIHSSEYRTLEDLLPDYAEVKGNKILMIGGGNSSGETAAAIAHHLSDAEFAPQKGRQKQYRGCKIVHVTPRPLYAVPPFNPVGPDSRAFLPLDLKFYDLSKRPSGPIEANAGLASKEFKSMIHGTVQTMIGGDQSDLGYSALVFPSTEPRHAAYVALSESYAEFVRSDQIQPVAGRATAVHITDGGSAVATIQTVGGELSITDVAAIVYANGYTPSSALNFIADETRDILNYDQNSLRLPLILEGYQTMSPAVSDLAFLGFYEGPYWPTIELQAHLAADRWLNHHIPDRTHYEDAVRLLELREAMREGKVNVPQYWFADYLGYMEELASRLRLTRNDGPFGSREGCTSPARYLSAASDKAQADAIMSDLFAVWNACIHEGKYVARAAFRALQGTWTVDRNIDSALTTFPSGKFEGTANFHPRSPTTDVNGRSGFDLEYLYIESGTLVLSNGASIPATRRYVYRYSAAEDQLSVWFVQPDDDLRVDYLFHNLKFATPSEAREAGACIARADHPCVDDMYWTEYRLPIQGVALHEFEVKHRVKGPEKDYVMTTSYQRPRKELVK